jgi:nitrite reductase (NADH) large subunit
MPWLMDRQLDREAGAVLKERIEGLGIRVLLEASTDAIVGDDDGRVDRVRLKDGRELPAGLVVMAVGVRPETTLARSAGLECGRGIMVDDTLATSDPRISAIGECAEHRSLVYGLVLPAYEQAEVLARRLAGEDDAAYEGSVTYTSLKVSGVPVFSAGEVADEAPGEALLFRDLGHGIYKRLLLRDDRLVGAVLVGEVTDGAWYADLIRAGRDVAATRGLLAFGRALAEPAGGAAPPLGLAA